MVREILAREGILFQQPNCQGELERWERLAEKFGGTTSMDELHAAEGDKMLRKPGSSTSPTRISQARLIDAAILPGLQGRPHNHTTAAIAVAR